MILLTGYGSIGSMVAKRLVPTDHLLIIDKDEEAIHKARMELGRDVIALVADVSNPLDMDRLFHYPISEVVHTAAMKHVTFCEDNPTLATINNILGINLLLDRSARVGVHKFVNVSTDKSAAPANVMGATKFIAERLVSSYDTINAQTKFQNVRLGNVLCSTGSLVPTIKKAAEGNLPLMITDLNATRFYMTPDDVCDFIIDILQSDYPGQIIIKKLKSASLGVMVKAILELVDKRNYQYSVTGLRRGEKMHEDLFTDTENTHMIDLGDRWIINFDEDHPAIPAIDSSGLCVSYEEFRDTLRPLMKCLP